MKYKRYGDFKLGYIDFLSATLGVFLIVSLMAIALMSVIKKENEGIKKNADYVITMQWPTEIDCDVDLWVRDPQNNIVSYVKKEGGAMYYERDDKGKRHSLFQINGQVTTIDPDNKEFITIRGAIRGEYIINIHLYSCKRDDEDEIGMKRNEALVSPVPVTVEVIKINPTYMVVQKVQMTLERVWQEKTAVRMIMDDNKTVLRYRHEFVSVKDSQGEQGQGLIP
jgi:hypothetical protein